MYRSALLIICLTSISLLGGLNTGPWSDIRFSGKDAADQVLIRLETEAATAAEHTLLYYNGSAIVQQPFSELDPASHTLQAAYTAVGTNADLGLVAAPAGQPRRVNPVYYSGTGLPALGRYTLTAGDPANDQGTSHLDLVADYCSFSDTKLYAAIQNRGGGFPLSGALGFPPYYSYMYAIAAPDTDPSNPNTIIWVLNYIQVTFGGLEPGLYKITGTSAEDLVRIGDIATSIDSANNLLKMSCDLAPLLADPDFMSWFDPADPVMGVMSLTNRTTLSGLTPVTENTDTSSGARAHLKRLSNPLHPEILPSLTEFGFFANAEDVWFETMFTDAYGRFPLSIRAEWLPGQSFELLPQTTDHSQPVRYRSANLLGLLNEYDEVPSRAAASLDNLSWAESATQPYSYVLGLQNPQNLTLQASGELSWSAVEQTLLGNSVSPDHYVVEADSDPGFGSPRSLGEVADTTLGLPPAEMSGARQFFRVRAVKLVP